MQNLNEEDIRMKYDFTSILDRRGKDSMAADQLPPPGDEKGWKIKEGFTKIPMWVADMNFPVAPSVTKALTERISHPSYGYFTPRDAYYEAIIRWQRERNKVVELPREAIGYENGVLGGIVSALHTLCSQGDAVLIHTPAYIGFTNILTNNGYKSVHSPLTLDGNGVWRMDYVDMEEKIKRHHIHAAIFCSPHNPSGRVWERWEIERAMEIFKENDVYVISDEIWSDIILEGHRHIPTQSVSEDAKMRTVAMYAPTKTFSLAGLIGSYHIIYNPYLRDRIRKESSLCHYNEVNVLSMHSLIGAYAPEGQEWVEELCQVLTQNVNYACEYIEKHFEGVSLAKPQGTYMLFLDCTCWCKNHQKTLDDLLEAGTGVGVVWQDGRPFFGDCHIRMNLALPFSMVEDAFERLREYVFCK